MKNTNLIIDFDSTLVGTEALEELAKIVLEDDEYKGEIIKKIIKITNQGMDGQISFNESLKRRLKLLKANKKHIEKLVAVLKNQIDLSVNKNKQFFIDNKNNIYIISGGFIDFVLPVVNSLGVKKENIIANSFIYNNGDVVGFDETNQMSRAGGKVAAVKQLNLKGKTVVVGDGWTDYEIKNAGLADKFIAFTKYAQREKVISQADFIVDDFNKVIEILEYGKI